MKLYFVSIIILVLGVQIASKKKGKKGKSESTHGGGHMQTILSFSSPTMIARDAQEEYLGCHIISATNDIFNVTPGDYNPSRLSPIQCMLACGRRAYAHAGIQNGDLCLCTNKKEEVYTAREQCIIRCSGTGAYPELEQPACGGANRISVYNVGQRITGFKIHDVKAPVDVYKVVNISAKVTSGDNVDFTFKSSGDANIAPKTSKRPFSTYTYDRPGKSEVVIEAKNSRSGKRTESTTIVVIDSTYKASITCPKAQTFGNGVECSGFITRGSPEPIVFQLGDGLTEVVYPNVYYGSVGIRTPHAALTNTKRNLNFTLIIPHTEFPGDSIINGWEMDVLSEGVVYLQVFRPSCGGTNEVYCESRHLCLTATSECTEHNQWKCKDGEYFCFIRERCVRKSQSTAKSCDAQVESQLNSAPADYTLVHQVRYVTKGTGHQILTLDEPMNVKKSDVIGWTAERGQINYIDNHETLEPPEFLYTPQTTVGSVFRRDSQPLLKHWCHVVSALYTTPSLFYFRHMYTNTGAYYITSSTTSPKLVYVDHVINKMTYECPEYKLTNQVFTIKMTTDSGSNITYTVTLTNGTTYWSTSGLFTKSFRTAGVYRLALKALNSVSSSSGVCSVSIYDDIADLKFEHPILPVKLGSLTEIAWSVSRATNVTYTLDFGNSISKQVLDFDNTHSYKVNHRYRSHGKFNVTIVATNKIKSRKVIHEVAVVDVPIQGMKAFTTHRHLTKNIYLQVGKSIKIEVAMTAGTSVFCQYRLDDGSESAVTPAMQYNHTYNDVGVYDNVTVMCWNSISRFVDVVNGTIIVNELEAITDLVVTASKTFFGEEAQIRAFMKSGSLYICTWDLGDGTTSQVDTSTFNDVINHRYKNVGNYIIQLTCSNSLGSVPSIYELPVEIPINGFGILCPSRYIPVNHEDSFFIFTKEGSRLSYKINFGDGNQTEFSSQASKNRTEVFKHVYLKPGDYFVTVLASNQLDQLKESCPHPITVEYPVKGFSINSNSPLRLVGNIVEFTYALLPGCHFPTNARIYWDLGDGTREEGLLRQPELNENKTLKTYSFAEAGVYTVKVMIRNNITTSNLELKIDVQEIIPIEIHTYENVSRISSHRNGRNQTFFTLGHHILINVTSQPKDKTYTFDFGDMSAKQVSNNSVVSHLYETDGVFTIGVEVKNTLGVFHGVTQVDVQEDIKNMNVSVTSFILLGNLIDVNVTAEKYGSKICGIIDFGDGNVTVINRMNCERFEKNYSKNVIAYDNSTRGVPIKVAYKYQYRGWHNVSVFIANDVSKFYAIAAVFVKYQPCPYPEAIISAARNASLPLYVKRLNRLVIQGNATVECPVAANVTFAWEIFQNGSKTPLPLEGNYGIRHKDMPLTKHPGLLDVTVFEIDKNVLPYGLVKVQLKITYDGAEKNLRELIAKDETWFHVMSTDIYTVIEGGTQRAVGYGLSLLFNASRSSDPDQLDDGELHFKWYCRRAEEQFNVFFDKISPTNRTAGCFRNGRYYLTTDFESLTILNKESSMISMDTTMMTPGDFVMRVYIQKGRRSGIFNQAFTVKRGEPPPALNIVCKLNCFEKKNPTQALIIGSNCKNCGENKIHYRWHLYITSRISGDRVISIPEEEIEDLDVKTTTSISSRNLALKEGVLIPGMDYVMKVSAWREKSTEEKGGFASFKFSVNRPPYGGYCNILPPEGVSLNTKFQIRCDEWKDESPPLSYSLATFRDGVEQNVYSGPDREVNMILPLGNEAENFTYQVIIKIEDKFQFGTIQRLDVRVTEPLEVNYNDVTNDMDKLASSGDVQALARMALAAGSIMNKDAGRSGSKVHQKNSKEDAEHTRTKMISSLTKVKPCTLSAIKQMSGVQGEMTKVQDQVSPEAQDQAGGSVDSMSDCMVAADATDPAMLETAESMLSVSSNLMESGKATQKNVSDVKGKTNADKVMDSVNKVGGAISRQLVAGDKPKKMKAGGMDIEVSQVADEADEEETGFKLPPMSALFNSSDDDQSATQKSAGAMVSSMADNPYKGGAGSDDVKSDVMALSVGSPDGKPMDLAGLEMTMFVKRDLKHDVPPTEYEFDLGEKGRKMKIHKFNYTTEVNSMVIEVRPLDENIASEIFISYERRPTVSNVVTKYTQITPKQAKTKKKLPDPFIRVIGPDELNGTGMYYLGIKLSPSKTEIFAEYEYIPNMNYSLRTWEAGCKVWDEDEKKFVTEWCKVGPKTTFIKTQCTCVMGGNDTDDDGLATTMSPDMPLATTSYNNVEAGGGDAYPGAPGSAASTPSGNSTSLTDGSSSKTAIRSRGSEYSGRGVIVSGNEPRPTIKIRPKAVAPRPKKKKVIKRATFAGGFFVAPNPIDFSKAFAGFSNLAENPVAFAAVLSIFGVYLLLLFWARREDRKDIERAGVTALPQNDPIDRQFYEITINTGFGAGAATTANVFIRLAGDEGQTPVRQLKDDNRKLFQKRGQDVFLASFPDFIGDLQYVRIWHDNVGKSPSWNLSSVMVHDLNADYKYLFINENIIAVEEGDGSLERVIPVAGAEEIKSFNHLFFSTSQKHITDSHIWFSIFIRPPKSRFTRVQRLSCCLTLLYCTMVTNAMFYEVGGEANPATTLHVGPLAFSTAQIGIGIITSLIIFPVNLLIVGVFRGIGPKPSEEELEKKKSQKWWWVRELFFCCAPKQQTNFIDIIKETRNKDANASRCDSYDKLNESAISLDGPDIGLKMETEAQEKQRAEKAKKQKKQKKKLPYWMKYFAWTLLVLVSFTTAFFVILYGFQFGKEKSAQWLSALFVSFFQDVCVSQPLKIVGIALFIAMIVKKPMEEEEDDDGGGSRNKIKIDEQYLGNAGGENKQPEARKEVEKEDIIRFKPPSKKKIRALRTYRLKELKMYNLIREIIIYLLFVVALCQVTYSQMDPQSYDVRRSMENVFINGHYGGGIAFSSVDSIPKLWSWLNTTVIKGLYSSHWYNGKPKEPGFLPDLYSNLFGGSRLRQLRVKNDSCVVAERFLQKIKDCHSGYTWSTEDTGLYDRGWKPLSNASEMNPPSDYRAWQYQTRQELATYPFMASNVVYRGGGYVAEMGKDPRTSHKVIQNLYDNMWLDAQTRALFFEVTVYNAQVNLFAIMNYIVEFYPTNGVVLFSSIKIAKLYTFGGSAESFSMACQFFVLIFFVIFIYKEGRKIYRERKSYFTSFWNLVEFSSILLVVSCIGVFGSRLLLVNKAVEAIRDNPGQFVSFNKVVQWDVLFSALTSMLVFLSCLKAIKLLQYNQTISLLASTLQGSAKPLAAFSIVFLVFFLSFTTFAYLVFVPHLSDYKTFIDASQSVMSLLLGGFSFSEIRDSQPILGPIWFTLIMLFGVMYIMNVFLSIIMETYANVKEDLSMQSQEFELMNFMCDKFMHLFGKGDKKKLTAFNGKKGADDDLTVNSTSEKNNFAQLQKQHLAAMKQKKYNEILNNEIDVKFAQLNDSLNEYFIGNFDLDGEERKQQSNIHGLSNPSFDYSQISEAIDMEEDLSNELSKWQ